MISVKEIDQLIKQPQQVSESQLSDLKTLSEKYPYSQVFSILYLKGLKNKGDFHFDDELTKHSYRITDRVQLYNLIEGTEFISEPVLQIIAEQVEEKKEIVQDDAPVIELEVQQDLSVDSNTINIDTAEEKKETIEEEKLDITDAVDKNILHHALTASYQLDELTEAEEEELVQRQLEGDKEEVDTPVEPITEDKPVESGDSTHSFTAWLKANNNYEEDDDKDREHIKKIVTNFENFDPSDDLFGEVEKPKAEFFSPAKKAKESLNDSSVPVSETLAKIYALQGNYPKAIEAYEQLSLINPEKKIFFADRIKELKKKIHSK
ncbi:MAG: tetratricopeptide repeat protein [Crocinitomicaceae bacterium]